MSETPLSDPLVAGYRQHYQEIAARLDRGGSGVEREASKRNQSVGAVIREAVGERLRASTTDKQAALARLLARADSLPNGGPIDWDKEKDAFERNLP